MRKRELSSPVNAGEAPRAFISSVMTGFQPYRTAARNGVIDAGAKPILIEDFSALDSSSRSACLDLVRSSDIYLVLIGDRPGSSPLGKPVVEEEFEEARRRKLPRLLFVQDIARDRETQALVDRLSDYVHGRFRTGFRTPDELRAAIAGALTQVRGDRTMQTERNEPSTIEVLLDGRTDSYTTLLRLALIPERKDEVFDILLFEDGEFRRAIFQLAHRDDVRLFDFEQGTKTAAMEERELIVKQEPRRGGPTEIGVTLRLGEDGRLSIDQTLAGRTNDRHGFGLDIQIAENDIAEAIRSGIAFANALYDKHDPGHRYSIFLYGAAVAGMSMHVVVRELRHQQSWSLPMDDRGWYVLDKPRRIDRTDLANPSKVIARTLAFISKRYGERK